MLKILLLSSLITLNAWADDEVRREWERMNKEFNIDSLMKAQDHNGNIIDLREQVEQHADPKVLGSSYKEGKDLENSVRDKRPDELEIQGREAMSQDQEKTNFLMELHRNTDPSQPGIQGHINQAKQIANERANMGDTLSQYLKEKYGIDIGCTSTGGSQQVSDNPFVMGEEVQEIRNETYEPQYCEHLLNTYECTTDLHINCLKQGHKTLKLDIKEANIGYRQEENLIHFDHVYANSSHVNKVGKVEYTFHHLGTTELRLVFEIPSIETLELLSLINVNFSHSIFVKLNGHNVYPSNWTDLKAKTREVFLLWSHIRRSRPEYHEKYRCRYRSMTYYDQYPRLDYGTGSLVINVDTRENSHVGDIDLTRFVRPGHNELIIKGGSIGHSYIRATLRSLEKACLKWSEKWVETCTLQPS